ncbi:MAG: nodulation protein NfeD [Bacteroidetes bacterium]|nr:nodulation protein NfeD [Bacteroidota bacterium]
MLKYPILYFALLISGGLYGQEQIKVMVMEIKSTIDPRTTRYVNLALEHADKINAELIILEMDTYGGTVNDAKDIVEFLLDLEIPVYVFIDKDAASAGALISIACDSIYMSPGSSIGAATVVVPDGTAAPDKYQSYMKSTMRSTAEETGRDPEIAEAMVDEDIEIEGITKAGNVLTFTVSEAIKHGFCEAQVKTIEEILKRSGIESYEIYRFTLDTTEKIIAVFLNPFISGLLIMIIIGGIYFELQTPGVGFPILASLVAVIFYFVPYYLNGLAENWEIIAFMVGVVLLALEIFVIPGFGIFGISGLILTVGSMILVMVNNDIFDFSFVADKDLFLAITTTLTGIVGGIMLLFVGGVRLTQTKFFKKIALESVMDSKEGYTSSFIKKDLIGKTGTTYTVLRPSGKIMIEGEFYDAYTRGNYIKKDEKIIVIADEGTTLKVHLYTEEDNAKT